MRLFFINVRVVSVERFVVATQIQCEGSSSSFSKIFFLGIWVFMLDFLMFCMALLTSRFALDGLVRRWCLSELVDLVGTFLLEVPTQGAASLLCYSSASNIMLLISNVNY